MCICGLGRHFGRDHVPPQPVVSVAADGFDWGAAGIGAGAAIGLALLASGMVVIVRQTRVAGIRTDAIYTSLLPELVRTALAVDDATVAARLLEGVEPITPLAEHSLVASRAALSEAAREHVLAAELYDEAVTRWQEFGNVPEHAHALLGRGRCFAALGKPEAETPLREARELFARMGYQPALGEVETLLGENETAMADG